MVQISDGGPGFSGRAKRATPDQMKARKADEAATKAKQARKLDTRKKIIMGGALMALAKAGDPAAWQLVQKIIQTLPERDRATVER